LVTLIVIWHYYSQRTPIVRKLDAIAREGYSVILKERNFLKPPHKMDEE
jgi:hypothetical protein